MGRRFDSYFQETEIAQWVEQFTQTLICLSPERVPLETKAKKFSFRIENIFPRNEFEIRSKTCLKPEFETLVDD